MKCACLQPSIAVPFQFPRTRGQHLRSRIFGISERKNFVGPSMPFANEIGNALRKNGGLTGASAGDHEHRAMHVSNGLLLPFVSAEFSAQVRQSKSLEEPLAGEYQSRLWKRSAATSRKLKDNIYAVILSEAKDLCIYRPPQSIVPSSG